MMDLALGVLEKTEEESIAEMCSFCLSTLILSKHNWAWACEKDLLSISFKAARKFTENISIGTSFLTACQVLTFSDEGEEKFAYIERVGVAEKVLELIEFSEEKSVFDSRFVVNVEQGMKALKNFAVSSQRWRTLEPQSKRIEKVCKRTSHLQVSKEVLFQLEKRQNENI